MKFNYEKILKLIYEEKKNFDYILKNSNLKTKKELVNKLTLYEDYIPMYNIYENIIYLNRKEGLFNKLIKKHFRFINNRIKLWFELWIDKLEKKKKEKKLNYTDTISLKKYKLMIYILSFYDVLYRVEIH